MDNDSNCFGDFSSLRLWGFSDAGTVMDRLGDNVDRSALRISRSFLCAWYSSSQSTQTTFSEAFELLSLSEPEGGEATSEFESLADGSKSGRHFSNLALLVCAIISA